MGIFQWDQFVNYKGIKLLDGRSTRPCGHEPIESHDDEYDMFMSVLENVKSDNPVMVECGSWWAFWSLAFRKKFPSGRNILIELGKRQISIGRKNFALNGFDESHYWGGFYINDSNVYAPPVRESNYNYDDHGGYWDTTLSGQMTGPEINFTDVYEIEGLDQIDMLHMDIQGSEYRLIVDLYNNNRDILDKIQNVVIATHHPVAQQELIRILVSTGMRLLRNEPFGSVGGDGMIVLTRN